MTEQDLIVCGVCGSDKVERHCENDQCSWSRCLVKGCGAFGNRENWVVTK